jgi:diguanylate cyclase (GGDEF)-like protein/PAS domain S-box-containing protein
MAAHNHKLPPLPDHCFKTILDHTFDGVNYVDDQRRILYWNKGAERITGYSADEVIGRQCQRDGGLCHIDDQGVRLCDHLCPLLTAIGSGREIQKRVYLLSKSGKRVPVDAATSPVFDAEGNTIGAVQVFRDATAYEDAEREAQVIAKLAATDPLTGLLNRRAIEIELEIEANRAHRLKLPMSVIFGDLDYFKMVNDQHGHPVGDEVLKGVAKLLQAGVREYDRASRYGGEEFLIMLPETKAEIAQEIAERLRKSISVWKLIHQEKLWPFAMTISFGVAELQPGESWEHLVERADRALYRAKKAGRNQVFVS